MSDRVLPPEILVQPGTDVPGEWERFEVFEALHHGMRICNPMSSTDLDEVIDTLAPTDGESMLDIACGHGELLIRSATRAAIRGVGIDRSPWVLVRALSHAQEAPLVGRLQWRLGDAHELPPDERFDIVTCIGASWIWHGFEGTAAAMVKRCRPGGRIGIGDLRLRDGADPEAIAATYGRVFTADEQRSILNRVGVEVTAQFDPGMEGWDGYQHRIMASAEAWAADHPGEKAQGYLDEQRQWRDDHDRDRGFLAWTVWTGRVC